MKKTTLLLALIICVCLLAGGIPAQSQNSSLLLLETQEEIYAKPDIGRAVAHLVVRNIGDEEIQVAVRMLPDLSENHSSSFCWGEGCYPSTVFVSPEPVSLKPGEQTDINDFSAYLRPRAVEGESSVTYEFFDVNDEKNKVLITIKYKISNTITSVDDPFIQGQQPILSAYPTPANDVARINYTIPHSFSQASIAIYNVFGNEIVTFSVQNPGGSVIYPTASLNGGVYFCSLIVDGKRIATRKLIVKH